MRDIIFNFSQVSLSDFNKFNFVFIIISIATAFIGYLLLGLRDKYLFHALGYDFPYNEFVKINIITQFLAIISPAKSGELMKIKYL